MQSVIDPHISPELVVSGLRLLLDGYKVARDRFRDKKTPDRIEEIVLHAEKASPRAVDKAEMDRRITEALDPDDAAIVKGDLELLGLLLLPTPALEAFDYWGKLNRLVAGVQAYATKNRFFELRGVRKREFGEVLYLPRTGRCILPPAHAAELAIPGSMEGVKEAVCLALLRKEARNFPVQVGVEARFNVYSVMGGPPGVRSELCFFRVERGQQPHWLAFDRGEGFGPHFKQGYEYMLEAADFISIVQAIRDDIRGYANAIQLDEQKVAPFFKEIDAFAGKA